MASDSYRILVLGSTGQMGQTFQAIDHRGHTFYFANREELDFTKNMAAQLDKIAFKPNIIINCAAYTQVDLAEREEDLCTLINTTSVAALAEYCRIQNIKLVHYSSDYVYHNEVNSPNLEEDETNASGVYAKSKLAGEQVINRSGCSFLIIRTSWVISPFGNNFVKTMLRLFPIKDELNIVNDQIGAPTYTYDIATATLDLLPHIHNQTINYANEGLTSWFDFAQLIKELTDSSIRLNPISSEQYNAPAPRPKWSAMSMDKFRSLTKTSIPHWKDSVARCLNQLNG